MHTCIYKPKRGTMFSLLHKGHPKIFLTPARISFLTEQLEGDAFLRELIQSLLAEADRMLVEEPAEFIITGPRMLKQSQLVLNRISTLALAFLVSNRQPYLDRAKKELWAAAKFPHWNPSHFLDTAELCTAFAIGYDWLYSALSETEKTFIRKSLIKKGLLNGLEAYRTGAWWVDVSTNWNLVCNGGLLIAALALADEEPELAINITLNAIQHLPTALHSYHPDGGWEAGPEYWDYSTWYTVLTIDALQTALNYDFNLAKTPGLENAGLFPIYCTGPLDRTFNYADSDDHCTTRPALFWLGKNYHLDACVRENHRLLRRQLDKNVPPDPFDVIWYQPPVEPQDPLPLNAHFSGTKAVFLRDRWNDPDATFLAFKGGSNQADHAHLDLGSFVLDTMGQRWVCDLGKDDYDLPGYWDMAEKGGRWQYFRLNTLSHNTLVLNNDIQRAQANARILKVHFSDLRSFGIVDLSEAYQPHARSVQRGLMLLAPDVVVVQDEIQPSLHVANVRWQVLTDAQISTDGHNAVLAKAGKSLYVKILQPKGAVFKIESAQQKPPEMSNNGFQQLVIEFTPKTKPAIFCVVFASTPRDMACLPLDKW
jgi:hypothetical protein